MPRMARVAVAGSGIGVKLRDTPPDAVIGKWLIATPLSLLVVNSTS